MSVKCNLGFEHGLTERPPDGTGNTEEDADIHDERRWGDRARKAHLDWRMDEGQEPTDA